MFRTLPAVAVFGVTLASCVAAEPISVPLVGVCTAADLGEGLLATAWHCRGMLPLSSTVVFDGGGPPATGSDLVIAHVQSRRDRDTVPCRTDARVVSWHGRSVILAEPARGMVRLPDAEAEPGESGSPVTTDDGAMVSIVIGRNLRTGEPYAIDSRVFCAAVAYARTVLRTRAKPGLER